MVQKNTNVMPMNDAIKKGLVPDSFKDLITIKDAAKILGLSYYTIIAQAKNGRFKAFWLGETKEKMVTTKKYVAEYLKNSKGKPGLSIGQKINRPSKKEKEGEK